MIDAYFFSPDPQESVCLEQNLEVVLHVQNLDIKLNSDLTKIGLSKIRELKRSI